jgi:hypothetical protein
MKIINGTDVNNCVVTHLFVFMYYGPGKPLFLNFYLKKAQKNDSVNTLRSQSILSNFRRWVSNIFKR